MSDQPSAINHPHSSLVVLAGGASTRMGRDKALLPVGGTTLLVHLARLGRGLGLPVLIVGRDRPPGWDLGGCDFVADERPGKGPLGGLITALGRCHTAIAIACDLPGLRGDGLAWLAGLAGACAGRDGAVAVRDGQVEPLFAVYHRRCAGRMGRHLAAGQRALWRLIEDGDFLRAEVPATIAGQLRDVDTPADWSALGADPTAPADVSPTA